MKIWSSIQQLFVGRINRVQFLQAVFLGVVVPIFIYLVLLITVLNLLPDTNLPAILFIPLFFIPGAVFYFIISSLHVRRLHDIGLPGWYVLIPLLREFSFVLSFFLPGEHKANQYGPVSGKKSNLTVLLNTSATSEDTGEKWIGILLTILMAVGFAYTLILALQV